MRSTPISLSNWAILAASLGPAAKPGIWMPSRSVVSSIIAFSFEWLHFKEEVFYVHFLLFWVLFLRFSLRFV